jgi:hypothetical protein
LIAATAWALALALGPVPLPATAQPGYKISAAQLQQVLARRFPLRYQVAGLLDLRIRAPELRFLPEQNRLGSELAIDASGPALARSVAGFIDLDFALRYEPSDMSIRAHRIRVQSVRLPGLPPDAAALIDAYARASAQRALLEVVLHQLQPRDLALADTMGLQPGSITVDADGLSIGFVSKPAPPDRVAPGLPRTQ